MNEERTTPLSDKRSFEDRVFARFDAIDDRFERFDARFGSIEQRLDKIEAEFGQRLEKIEARNYDTKPIWERALAAIMETNLEVGGLKKQVASIEGKVGVIEGRVGVIEHEITAMKKTIRDGLVDVRRALKHRVAVGLDMIHKVLLENRDDIRDAEERITELERKLA